MQIDNEVNSKSEKLAACHLRGRGRCALTQIKVVIGYQFDQRLPNHQPISWAILKSTPRSAPLWVTERIQMNRIQFP